MASEQPTFQGNNPQLQTLWVDGRPRWWAHETQVWNQINDASTKAECAAAAHSAVQLLIDFPEYLRPWWLLSMVRRKLTMMESGNYDHVSSHVDGGRTSVTFSS